MLIQQENLHCQEFGGSATWEKLLTDSQKLIAIQDLKLLLQRIPEIAGTVLGADIVILYEYREETDDVNTPPMVWGDIRYPKILNGKGITQPHRESAVFKMLDRRRRKPIYAPNSKEDWRRLIGLLPQEQHFRKSKDFIRRESVVSSAAVCLRAGGERVGVLFINYHYHHTFPKEERKAIEFFTSQVAIAIQNARLFQRERERAKAMALLQQVTPEISASLVETKTLDLIINGAMHLLGMNSGVIHLVDEAKQAVIRSYEAPPDFGHPKPRFSERKGKTWWVVDTGNMVVVPDITQDNSIHPGMSQMKVRAVLAAPLKVGKRVIGVLSLNDSKVHKFTEYEKTLLTMLADHAAIAIQNARLFQREREAMDLLQQITRQIIVLLDETKTLDLIINGAMQLLGMNSGVIHLVDEAKQAVIRSYEAPPDFGHPKPRFSERKGKTWWVVDTGNMVVVPDITQDNSIHPGMSQMKVRAVLAAPLKVGGSVIGVLSMNDNKVHEFTEYEKTLLTILADTAAIAIHNARELRNFQQARELAAIGQSATAMAHRMGTPLQDIRMTAELLQEKLQNTDVPRTFLQDIKDIINRVDQMVEAIARVRKAAQQFKPMYKNYDIGDIIKSSFTVNRSIAQQLEERKIQAEIYGLEQIESPLIECDRNLIEEAITNLVTNALEAVSDGGHIWICVSQTTNDFRIEVKDNGLGINQNLLSQTDLFEPFRTTKKGGLGLGLFIVRRNVEAHGGSTNYDRMDQVSSFRIEIPRRGPSTGELSDGYISTTYINCRR